MSDLLPFSPAQALELWRAAAKLEVGLRFAIKQVDLDRIRPVMYSVRKAAIDREPELGSLMLCVAPGGEEIWLVKKTTEAP